jgi:carbamoyl-phosphate synthase large subunit
VGVLYIKEEDFERQAALGIHYSRVNEILIEESVIGWKEYELEIMRDRQISGYYLFIENLDPMGIHTGIV